MIVCLFPRIYAVFDEYQPEESISIQHAIGADIIMQLDDVGKLQRDGLASFRTLISPVPSLMTGSRVEEAMERSVRWLDRCIAYHEKAERQNVQNLFAIVQGGLDPRLRGICLDEMIKRKEHVAGYAIGGLSGGEEKGLCSGLATRMQFNLTQVSP